MCIHGPFLGIRPATNMKAWVTDFGVKHRTKRVGQQGFGRWQLEGALQLCFVLWSVDVGHLGQALVMALGLSLQLREAAVSGRKLVCSAKVFWKST